MRNSLGQFERGTPNPNKKVWVKKTCPACQSSFEVKPSLIRVIHCSQSCARKGKDSPRKGAVLSPEQKSKISTAHRTWKERNPERVHWNFIGDRSLLAKHQERNDMAYKEWRKQVWLRDNFVCKIANPDCKGRIEAHHILSWTSYPKLRYEVNNGITLCHFHHPRKRLDEAELSPYFQKLVAEMK